MAAKGWPALISNLKAVDPAGSRSSSRAPGSGAGRSLQRTKAGWLSATTSISACSRSTVGRARRVSVRGRQAHFGLGPCAVHQTGQSSRSMSTRRSAPGSLSCPDAAVVRGAQLRPRSAEDLTDNLLVFSMVARISEGRRVHPPDHGHGSLGTRAAADPPDPGDGDCVARPISCATKSGIYNVVLLPIAGEGEAPTGRFCVLLRPSVRTEPRSGRTLGARDLPLLESSRLRARTMRARSGFRKASPSTSRI